MTSNMSIPDAAPARPGASSASANDLRGGFQSATLDMRTGQVIVETKGVQKATAGGGDTGSSVFTSVKSASGTIKDAGLDTVVSGPSIPGDGVRLRDAIAAGFVSVDKDGNYTAGPATPESAAAKAEADKAEQAKKDKGDDGTGERFDDAKVETNLDTIIEGTDADTQLAAVSQAIETGEVSAELIASAAQSMGVKAEDLQGQVGGVLEAFENQAREVITKASGGIDSERVLTWVREHRADALQKAMHAHGTQRSTALYGTLAREYVSTLDQHDPESILSAEFGDGITARRDGHGKIVLNINGQDTPWATAVRSGALTVKGG